MLELFDVKQVEDESKFELIIKSDDKKTLENIYEMIVTSATRCNVCEGEVTKSGDRYLCLSGCGHVDGNGLSF